MYIKKIEIKNIRSVRDFSMRFDRPAGWHVLIGDNGAGKSTIIRSVALGLTGREAPGLRANLKEWLNHQAMDGKIELALYRDIAFDDVEIAGWDKSGYYKLEQSIVNVRLLWFNESKVWIVSDEGNPLSNPMTSGPGVTFYQSAPDREENGSHWQINKKQGFFSAAFGPFRRFEGGNLEWNELFKNPGYANLAAHLSAFGEDVALTEAIGWLKDLNYKTLERKKESRETLENLKTLINSEDFLPHKAKLESISSDGVFFTDGNGATIAVNQMSDGYRSILSLTFELIRQLVRVYGAELVFENIAKGQMFIDLPGVVLVDEIDAHLHPTWQTRIGQWFTKYFPQLQFIVTTHSPLVCRACERGSIWRLAAPGSDEKSGEVTGTERDRLIYGNVLDAYGTEVFGANVTINLESVEKKEELVELNKKKMAGVIKPEEETKLEQLRKTFTTDDPIDL